MKKNRFQKIILFAIISLLIFTTTYSQDLSGHWQGVFNSDYRNGRRYTYFLDMVLHQVGRNVEGRFSNSSMDFPNSPDVIFEISGISGKKDKIPRSLMVGKILYNRLLEDVAEYFLQFDDIRYIKNDSMEVLYGVWLPNGTPRATDGRAGTFWVRKLPVNDTLNKIVSASSLMYKQSGVVLTKHDSLHIPEQMVKRKNVEQGQVIVNTKTISLSLYDNGIVDDDTVSVFFNGKLLLSHQHVSEKPIQINIELDENNFNNEIILFAENLGKISPNTALIVVTAGDKRYELFAKTDLQENAVLRFKYEPN